MTPGCHSASKTTWEWDVSFNTESNEMRNSRKPQFSRQSPQNETDKHEKILKISNHKSLQLSVITTRGHSLSPLISIVWVYNLFFCPGLLVIGILDVFWWQWNLDWDMWEGNTSSPEERLVQRAHHLRPCLDKHWPFMKFTLQYQKSNVCLSLYVSSATSGRPGCSPPVARAGTGSSPPHDSPQRKG